MREIEAKAAVAVKEADIRLERERKEVEEAKAKGKEAEAKVKEAEAKGKEADAKGKEADAKGKEADAKMAASEVEKLKEQRLLEAQRALTAAAAPELAAGPPLCCVDGGSAAKLLFCFRPVSNPGVALADAIQCFECPEFFNKALSRCPFCRATNIDNPTVPPMHPATAGLFQCTRCSDHAPPR